MVQFSAQSSGSSILSRIVPSITLTSGATVSVATAGNGVARQVLVTGGLSLSGSIGVLTSKLDLSNNDAIVQGGDLGIVTSEIEQGYKGGTWQGSAGIVSSTAASNSTHLTALGAILNDDGTHTGNALYASFDGNSTGEGDVLIKYTYYGDANLDGKVDGADYSRIDSAVLANRSSPGSATGWFNGDFNYDGVINGSDYTLIDNAFNTQGAQLAAVVSTAQIAPLIEGAAVPEPTSLLVFSTTALALLGRRRRPVQI
jgi:hypothetical protein